MKYDEYIKNRKVFFLYSVTITCIIAGLLLFFGKLVFVSDNISRAFSYLFIFGSYLLLLKIASSLKKKDIHGVTAIAWSSLLLFFSGATRTTINSVWWSSIQTITIIILVYFLVDGIIRLVSSLVTVVKTAVDSEEKVINGIDTVVAVLTSLLAIIISIIEIW